MKGAQFCQKNRPFDCWGITPLCSSKQCEIGTSAAMANKAFRSKQPQWWFNKQLVNKTARLKMIQPNTLCGWALVSPAIRNRVLRFNILLTYWQSIQYTILQVNWVLNSSAKTVIYSTWTKLSPTRKNTISRAKAVFFHMFSPPKHGRFLTQRNRQKFLAGPWWSPFCPCRRVQQGHLMAAIKVLLLWYIYIHTYIYIYILYIHSIYIIYCITLYIRYIYIYYTYYIKLICCMCVYYIYMGCWIVLD